jgi:hypothetical protein
MMKNAHCVCLVMSQRHALGELTVGLGVGAHVIRFWR